MLMLAERETLERYKTELFLRPGRHAALGAAAGACALLWDCLCGASVAVSGAGKVEQRTWCCLGGVWMAGDSVRNW